MAKKRRKMSEIAKDAKSNRNRPDEQPGEPITRGEWLETVIKLSKTAIEDGDGNGMARQVENYSKELKLWRKNESKN